jgi:hypothetical protein
MRRWESAGARSVKDGEVTRSATGAEGLGSRLPALSKALELQW